MVRPGSLLYFYRKRLRVHAVQELLAGLGIAVGVALVFSVLVANSSITGSARQIFHALSGDTSVQLGARSAQGFEIGMLTRVQALPGVEHASALLDQRAAISYGGRRVLVDFVGLDPNLPALRGITTRRIGMGVVRGGVVLTTAVADVLGVADGSGGTRQLPQVAVSTRGRSRRMPVSAVLGSDSIDELAGALIVSAALPHVQAAAGLQGRITRIFVVAEPGREALARAGVERLAAGRLTVLSVGDELRSLQLATRPIDQSTNLFAAISAFVGLLFTFTAMLLTVPERRRFVAELRMMGYRRLRVVQILGFQAVVLGVCASALGLLAGYLLSGTAAHDPPGYLAFAYPLGTQSVISWQTAALAFAGGVLASCLAAAQPLLDLRRGSAMNEVLAQRGEPGHAIGATMRRTLALCGLALLVAAGLVLLLEPSVTILGILATAVAMVLAIPAAFAAVLQLSDRPAGRWRLNSLALAVRALRATSLRSLGLVATGAVAVFGAVGLEGAHRNLLNGLYADYRGYVGTADVWIAQPGDDLALQPFDARGLARRVAAVDGVREVRAYGGGLLDVGERRVWVIARPRGDSPPVPLDQVVAGDLRLLGHRLRTGGWITVSQQIAEAEGVEPGERLRLPTPTGEVSYRVAATTTNLGWGPGAIVMSREDQRRAWASDDPTALELDLDEGADPAQVVPAIRRALGDSAAALTVQTAQERSEHANGIAREGLARLRQISTLLLLAAALAMAAAMGAGVWQRRAAIAQLRVMGWRSAKLWRALLWEAALVLGTGCLVGAVAGVYGHYLGDRWLQHSTGYPAPFAFAGWQMAAICAFVSLVALIVVAIPGMLVSRTSPRVGLDAGA